MFFLLLKVREILDCRYSRQGEASGYSVMVSPAERVVSFAWHVIFSIKYYQVKPWDTDFVWMASTIQHRLPDKTLENWFRLDGSYHSAYMTR